MELVNSCTLKFKDDDDKTISVGEEINYENGEEIKPKNAILMSTVKDSFGNVYSVNDSVYLSELDDFIREKKQNETGYPFEPSNKSCQYLKDYTSYINNSKAKNIPKSENPNNKHEFDCYIRGFLIINAYTKIGNETDKSKPHAYMVWLNQPTLIKLSVNDGNGDVYIDDLLHYCYKETEYVLKVLPNSTLSLPFKSEFYKTNFAKTEETELGQYDFYIMSACQYWSN